MKKTVSVLLSILIFAGVFAGISVPVSANKSSNGIKTVTVSKSSFTYNGKFQKPAVTVKDTKGNTVSKSYYKLSYKNNKNVGKATISIKFKGKYSGTKTLSFKIVPKGTSIKKLTSATKAFNAQWNKQSNKTTGYQLQYATNKNFKSSKAVTLSKTSTTSKKIAGLSEGTTYYVRIRTYKKIGGNKYYSAWSGIKSIRTYADFVMPSCEKFHLSTGDMLVGEKTYGAYYYSDWISETNESCICRSTSANGKSTKIVAVKDSEGSLDNFVTDGKWVYYSVSQNLMFYGTNVHAEQGVINIYKIGTDGKNKQKILSFKGKAVSMGGYYNGNLYYTVLTSSYERVVGYNSKMYKYNVKTGKAVAVSSKTDNLGFFSTTKGRYMVCYNGDNRFGFVSVFDAKTEKVVECTSEGYYPALSGNKIYYAKVNLDMYLSIESYDIYCCDLDGKNKKTIKKGISRSTYLLEFCGAQNAYFSDSENMYALNYNDKTFKKVS